MLSMFLQSWARDSVTLKPLREDESKLPKLLSDSSKFESDNKSSVPSKCSRTSQVAVVTMGRHVAAYCSLFCLTYMILMNLDHYDFCLSTWHTLVRLLCFRLESIKTCGLLGSGLRLQATCDNKNRWISACAAVHVTLTFTCSANQYEQVFAYVFVYI